MAWSITDTATKTSLLTTINNNLGTAAHISWTNASDTELAQTILYAGGNAFSTPSAGSMNLVNTAGSATTPLLLTSTTFTGSNTTKIKFLTSANAIIFQGTVGLVSGFDMNCDVIPVAGQTLRTDSLTLGFT